jgi:hypothetical protein
LRKFISTMERTNRPPEPAEIHEPTDLDAKVAAFFERRQQAAAWGPRALGRFDDEFIDNLPAADPELATVVYTVMATSELADVRGDIAPRIDLLYVANKEVGTKLWEALINDPDQGVSDAAYEAVKIASDGGHIPPDELDLLAEAYRIAKAARPAQASGTAEDIVASIQAFNKRLAAEELRDQGQNPDSPSISIA